MNDIVELFEKTFANMSPALASGSVVREAAWKAVTFHAPTSDEVRVHADNTSRQSAIDDAH